MSGEIYPTVFSMAALRDAIRRSRGWYKQIVRDCGCRYETLRAASVREDYVMRLDEAERISSWFIRYGVPTNHPSTVRAAALRQAPAGVGS